MENIYDVGIQIILFFQGLGDWIIPPMEVFTFLGDEQFYLLLAPVLYWCIDTTIGIRTAMMLMVSTSIYNYGKWLIHSPRPTWYSTGVKAYRIESSFGAPSGHTTNAVTNWGVIGISFRKKWLWVIAISLMILIGLSRIVLAVHFPHDVLLGWVIGTLTLLLFIKSEPVVKQWLAGVSIRSKTLLYFVISIGMILIGMLVLLPLRQRSTPIEWVQNAQFAFPDEEPFNPKSLSGQITIAGTFFGLALGHTLTFSKNGFSTKGIWWQLLLRYLAGAVGVFLIWFGLDQIFPDGDAIVPYFFRYIRYGLVGFWITYLAPKMFIVLKLANPLEE